MIVVDANVVIYFAVPGEHTAAAEALAKGDGAWSAPRLWRSEVLNTLVGYARRGMAAARIEEAWQRAARRLHGGEYTTHPLDVLRLGAVSGCSAYDLEYVALAERLGAPLITMDRQILREFPGVARPLA